jgi:hypothetical protein
MYIVKNSKIRQITLIYEGLTVKKITIYTDGSYKIDTHKPASLQQQVATYKLQYKKGA